MSGIHKSREVYKYTPTRDGRKLVPVRGLYVSGLHTEPRYMDHWLEVVGFTSNDGDIVDYTEREIDRYVPCIAIIGFENSQPTVINYSTSELNFNTPGIAIVGFDNQKPTIIEYNTNENQIYTPGFAIIGFEHASPTILNYYRLSIDSSLEHILTVVDYTSSECVIT